MKEHTPKYWPDRLFLVCKKVLLSANQNERLSRAFRLYLNDDSGHPCLQYWEVRKRCGLRGVKGRRSRFGAVTNKSGPLTIGAGFLWPVETWLRHNQPPVIPLFYDEKGVVITCSIGREYDECPALGWTPFLVSEKMFGYNPDSAHTHSVPRGVTVEQDEEGAEGPSSRASLETLQNN